MVCQSEKKADGTNFAAAANATHVAPNERFTHSPAAVSSGSSGCVHIRIMVGAASTSATSQVTTIPVTASALRVAANGPNRHTAQYPATNTTNAAPSNRYAAPCARSRCSASCSSIFTRPKSPSRTACWKTSPRCFSFRASNTAPYSITARSSSDPCANPIRIARTASPINTTSHAALISPAQGSMRTTHRLPAISSASAGAHNNVNSRRVRLFAVRDSLRTFAHSSGPSVPRFTGTNQNPIFFQNQLRSLFTLFTFTAISSLPLVQLVYLLAQCSKRSRREDSLHRQSKMFCDLKG